MKISTKKAIQGSKRLYEQYLKDDAEKSEEFYEQYLKNTISEGVEKSEEIYDEHLKEKMDEVIKKGKKLYEDGERKTKQFYEETFGNITQKKED